MLSHKKLLKFIEESLCSLNFKKKNILFIREVNGIIQILELQKYNFEIENKKVVTLNVGLVLPAIFKKVFNRPVSPTVSEGAIYFNIGELLNNFNGKVINKHWTLNNEDHILQEFEAFFENHLIPFLNVVNSPTEIAVFARNNKVVSKSTLSVKMQLEELNNSSMGTVG